MPPSYCAVEGSSGVGKTSTSRGLSREWGHDGYVPEYFHYFVPLGLPMPDLPPVDHETGLRQSRAWALIDRKRYAQLRVAEPRSRGLPLVLDTTVLSVLACELAKQEFGEPCAAREIAAEYRNLLSTGVLVEPVLWVLLDAPQSVLETRIRARGGSRSFLRREEVAGFLRELRAGFVTRYLSPDEVIMVDNSTLPLGAVVDRINAHVRRRSARTPSTGLGRFVDDVARGATVRFGATAQR
jgi:thymidylate kinase